MWLLCGYCVAIVWLLCGYGNIRRDGELRKCASNLSGGRCDNRRTSEVSSGSDGIGSAALNRKSDHIVKCIKPRPPPLENDTKTILTTCPTCSQPLRDYGTSAASLIMCAEAHLSMDPLYNNISLHMVYTCISMERQRLYKAWEIESWTQGEREVGGRKQQMETRAETLDQAIQQSS